MMAVDAAKSITGVYEGQWELFGLTPNGDVAKKSNWTDRIVAAGPVKVLDKKAFVSVKSEMKFEGGKIQSFEFTEGFFVNEDETAGLRFFETYGAVTIEKEIAEKVWAFETALSKWDLDSLGLKAEQIIFSKNLTTKVEANDDSKTEWVSRLTTIQWKDDGGKIQSKQFVSLQGHHKKVEDGSNS
jgi:hypothetical protein